MRKKLTHNLGLKLASLVLAFVLWFLVVQINDPKDIERFNNVQVKLINTELLEKEGKVYEVLDNTDKVSVTVSAPRSIISQMRTSDIVAEADVSRLTDINTIVITYDTPNVEVNSIEGDHDVVKLNVEDKKSKWIRLVSNTVGDVAEGYIVSNVSLDQTNIEISGPESAVSQVDHAVVDISVAGATTSLSANVDIQLYDAEGNLVDNNSLKKNVDYAHMTVEILATKDVPIEIKYMGVPTEGYLATGVVECSQATVKIAGNASALANVSSIVVPEDRMNITGATGNLVDIINLKEYLPDNIKFADKKFDGKVTATVYIEPVVEKELHIPAANVTIENMPEGFIAEFPDDLEHYDLKVSGLNEVVGELQQNVMSGVIDVAEWMEQEERQELKAGTYKMPVTFQLPENVTVKETVTVSIKVSVAETRS